MDLEEQLRAALVPTTPRHLVRAAVLKRLGAGSARRGPNRWVLTGVVLALAAAAAMLATQLVGPGASAVVADVAPVPLVSLDNPAPPASDTGATDTSPTTQEAQSQPVVPAVKPFTVQVLPLQGNVDDAPSKAAVETTYAAFVDGLRAVPGLTLVVLTKDEVPADLVAGRPGAGLSADYRVSLEGRIPPPSASSTGKFFIRMVAEQAGPGGRVARALHTGMDGETRPGCVSPGSMDVLAGQPRCADPAGVAAGLIITLRKMVFPPDPQMQQRLQARLADQALDPGDRLRALTDLASLSRSYGSSGMRDFAPALRDPAMIRAAIQLASTAPDPQARAQVWYTLRGSRDPELIGPLVTALRTDSDDDTRLQALATLAADFASDPQARIAFETAVTRESNPMLRALARRALGSEAAWMEYVLASLKDTGQSPVKRIEALFYAYGLPTYRNYGQFSSDSRVLRSLDDAAMRALTEVLPKAAADSKRYAQSSLTLVSSLALMDHPAVTDMLLNSLAPSDTALPRSFVVESLRRRTADSRVRAVLATIAAEDSDPQVRELAGKPLGPEEKGAPSMSDPPRLGVSTDYVKAAPNVPAELVGKLAITSMGQGFPADRAGMKEGDVLLEIGGKPITSGPQLIEVLDTLPRNVDVDVVISRNGQAMRLAARF